MPFTPLHFGPGAALAALSARHFSFTVFAFSQILIDIEPGVRMLLDQPPLHPWLHTYLGATLVALLSGWAGRPVCEALLRAWNRRALATGRRWLLLEPRIPTAAAWSAAVAGAYSHVALDSIMHADMRPWAPFAGGNALLGWISIEALELACAGLAVFGAGVMALRRLRRGAA